MIVTPEDGTFHPRMRRSRRRSVPTPRRSSSTAPTTPPAALYSDRVHRRRSSNSVSSRNIYLIMDDIYHKLVFDGKKAATGLPTTPTKDIETTRLVIVVNGVSKLYGMTGFRIGWTVAPQPPGRSDDQRPGADYLLRVHRARRRRPKAR